MKSIVIFCLALISMIAVQGQNKIAEKPRVFFSAGFVSPQYFGGSELLRSQELRANGLSYFENEEGERKEVGDYAANTGFSLSIGYYLPVKQVKGLSLGMLVNSGQTGSNPSQDGYAEGYFFYFVNFALGAQYYPFEKSNLYVEAEVGMGSVFTKNRFVGENNEQDFFHQFGIGVEGGAGIGYTFTPFSDKRIGLFVEGSYQLYNTRVEVRGIGNDPWQFGALHLSAGISF